MAASSSKCLPEEVETATSRPEKPFKKCKSKFEGARLKHCCLFLNILKESN